MSLLLDILPTDVFLLIINIWLEDCVKDVCALDVAIVNQALRVRYILAGCLAIKKEGFMKQIRIHSDEALMAVFKWKEKRGLNIKRIYLEEERDEQCQYLPHLGTLFPHLQEIKLYVCSIKLHHVLFASLAHLQNLTLDECRVFVSKEIVHNPLPTNIEELQLFRINYMCHYDGDYVPDNKEGEVFVWIAKCCPRVKVCSIRNCSVSYIAAIQMMRQWPLLKDWEFAILSLHCYDRFVSNADLHLLNQQTSSTMRKANLESVTLDDYYGNFDRDEKYLLNILLNYCNVEELRSLVLYINDWPVEYAQRLLQSISNMHRLQHITFKESHRNTIIPTFVYDVWNHCHLPHLTSLHLEKMELTNESINTLCSSVYAKQLTSLRLMHLRGVSMQTYQQVFNSFNQLQTFELILILTPYYS